MRNLKVITESTIYLKKIKVKAIDTEINSKRIIKKINV